MKEFDHPDKFVNRHIGPTPEELNLMARECGAKSVDDLIDQTIPSNIKLKEPLTLTPPLSEHIFLEDLKKIAQKNKVYKSYIGMGYYPAILPTVIQRNILENPGWYTQYTPYQAEIAQGRLEALLNFQTVVSDLHPAQARREQPSRRRRRRATARPRLTHHAAVASRDLRLTARCEHAWLRSTMNPWPDRSRRQSRGSPNRVASPTRWRASWPASTRAFCTRFTSITVGSGRTGATGSSRPTSTDRADHELIVFGGSILAFGHGHLVEQLSPDRDNPDPCRPRRSVPTALRAPTARPDQRRRAPRRVGSRRIAGTRRRVVRRAHPTQPPHRRPTESSTRSGDRRGPHRVRSPRVPRNRRSRPRDRRALDPDRDRNTSTRPRPQQRPQHRRHPPHAVARTMDDPPAIDEHRPRAARPDTPTHRPHQPRRERHGTAVPLDDQRPHRRHLRPRHGSPHQAQLRPRPTRRPRLRRRPGTPPRHRRRMARRIRPRRIRPTHRTGAPRRRGHRGAGGRRRSHPPTRSPEPPHHVDPRNQPTAPPRRPTMNTTFIETTTNHDTTNVEPTEPPG